MPKTKDNVNFYQVAIVGDGGVGKTSVTIQYTQNKFEGEDLYDPTIETSFYVKRQYEDLSMEMEIIDTAGQDDYKALRQSYMQSCYGFILVFDVSKADESLRRLQPFIEQIRSIKHDKYRPCSALDNLDFPCVIVGNKSDLMTHIPEKTISMIIKDELKLTCPIYYVSAKTRKNIEECFQHFVKVLRTFESHQPNSEWKYPNFKPPKAKKSIRSMFSSMHSNQDAGLERFNDDDL